MAQSDIIAAEKLGMVGCLVIIITYASPLVSLVGIVLLVFTVLFLLALVIDLLRKYRFI